MHCVTHLLGFQRIAEGRAGRLVVREALQKIGHLVHEAVLVANLQALAPTIYPYKDGLHR